MSQDSELFQKLADSLADDLVIDWALAESLADEDEKTIRNLGVLGQIAQLQGQASRFTQTKPDVDQHAFRWGHLNVQDRLGDGVYGEVFRAYDEVLERQVALKLLKTEVKSAVESMRFIDEARRMARVRHPHVLAIHGADVNEGRAGFWADLIVGKTLDHPGVEPITASELFTMSDDLSAGLLAIHQAGIVHGDIKPANVIKDDRGSYLIMDFGAGDRMDDAGQTGPAWQGTPLLMAPELILKQQSGPAADVYALGATLYKMATGQYPIEGDTLVAIQQAHQKQQRHSLRPLRPDLESEWVQLIESMLDPAAANRPTAKQIQQRLRHIEQLPQQRKNRRAAMTVIGALLLGLLFSGWGFYRAEQQKQAAITAKNQAEAISEFLEDMLKSSSEMGRGNDLRMIDVLSHAENNMSTAFDEQPLVAGRLHEALALSYLTLEMAPEAKRHLDQSLALKSAVYGLYDEPMLSYHWAHFEWFQTIQDYVGGLAAVDQYLAAVEPQWGADHGYVIQARIRQVEMLLAQTRNQEALQVIEQHLQHVPDPRTAENNQGFQILYAKVNTLKVLGRYQEAAVALEQVIEWQTLHPHKIRTNEIYVLTTKALLLLELDQPAEAIGELKQVQAETEVMFGKASRPYIQVLNNLSTAYRALPDNNQALATAREAFETSKALYGDEIKFDTIVIGGNLANMLVDRGDVAEGEVVMRENLDLAHQYMGPENTTTLIFEYNLAELLNNQGKHAEAAEWAASTYRKKAEKLGEQHVYTLLSLDNWAVALNGLGEHQAALAKHEALVPAVRATLGDEHIHSWLVMKHHVETLEAAGEIQSAIELLLELMAGQQAKWPDGHPDLVANQAWLNRLQAW